MEPQFSIFNQSSRLARIHCPGLLVCLSLIGSTSAFTSNALAQPAPSTELSYTNYYIASVPWSIHVVRVTRANSTFEFHSVHAGNSALGLSTLSAQIASLSPELGTAVAGINGDFYQREKAFAGDPRGLQIVEGEVISAPSGGVSFWIDGFGRPHATNVWSQFQVSWPDGTSMPCGLNQERRANRVVLYTPSLGTSTHTVGGLEFILEAQPGGPWLPLRSPRAYQGVVRKINAAGNSAVEQETMVISVAPGLVSRLPKIETGAILTVSTTTVPGLRGVRSAIGGGPMLVQGGRRQKNGSLVADTFEITSMLERHPRSALGWNDQYYFLVEVDGRQRELSLGMTLEELANFMHDLGCDEAMGLDGGGSATLWYAGKVRNRPCDGHQRDIANGLVLVRRTALTGTTNASVTR
jgi:hypothetical protein